jgi:hypothetical protein
MTDLSKLQLNAVLSALDGQPRNPNTKDATLRRIGVHAERLGISLDALLAAAAGLLDGRMSAEQFRTCLQDDAAEAAGRIEPIEEEAACIETPCAAPAPAGESNSEQNFSHCRRRRRRTVGHRNRRGRRSATDLGRACRKGPQAPRRHQGGDADRHAAPARGGRDRADHRSDRLAGAYRPRRLRRRALKKKRSLTVTSEKPDGGERVYRIAG